MVLRRPLMMITEENVRLLLLIEAKRLRYTFGAEVLPDITPINSIVNNINKHAVIHRDILFELCFQLLDLEILVWPLARLGDVFRLERVAARIERTELSTGEAPCATA